MARIVRCGLIQVHCEWSPTKFSLEQIKEKMTKHEKLISDAAERKVQILPPPIAWGPNDTGRPVNFTEKVISAIRAAIFRAHYRAAAHRQQTEYLEPRIHPDEHGLGKRN